MNSFRRRFNGKLKEIFIYVTNRCNLRCVHCYMGDSKNNTDMDINIFTELLKKLIKLGALKATFLGGEPTLHPLLPEFIKTAKMFGIKYLRVDTNGEFSHDLLKNSEFKKIDDICFSLDGINPQTHDKIRTGGNYYSVINNIKKAISFGYKVRVTTTINSLNLSQIEKMASKLEKIGVSSLNLHLTSENGRAKNNKWLLLDEEKWINYYKKIFPKFAKYNIKIKIPKRYIKENECKNYEVTCESAKSSRLLITPDFEIYSCPLLLDANRNFAIFKNGKFFYAKDYKKNVFEYGKIKGLFCPLLMKNNYKKYKEKQIIPLCVSNKQSNKDIAVKHGK